MARSPRPLLVWMHRYVGLAMAGFLIVAGLTGALLVWFHELDAAFNPGLMRVSPPEETASGPLRKLDPLVLREQVRAAFPEAWAHWVTLRESGPEDAASFWVEGAADADGRHVELGFDQVFVHPYTGEILGTRKWGDITQGLTNLMPFIYELHHSLALGTVGRWIFGIVAVLWTIDCFVGAWLTFPAGARNGAQSARRWWPRWAPAWKVRWRAGTYKLHYDLHRAVGLWPWALLLVLAWSSVAFNLYGQVYKPVMGLVFEMRPDPRGALPKLARDEPEPAMGWAAALTAARSHMATLSGEKALRVLDEDRVSYDPHRSVVRLEARTDRDVSERRGRTAVFIDAGSGALLATRLPTGEAAGDTVTAWLLTLHMAHVWGLPFRILMTVAGLAVTMLSVTGVYLWWWKRARRRRASRDAIRGMESGSAG